MSNHATRSDPQITVQSENFQLNLVETHEYRDQPARLLFIRYRIADKKQNENMYSEI